MLIKPKSVSKKVKFKYSIYKFRQNKFLKNGVSRVFTDVKGRKINRYRKKNQIKKYIKNNTNLNNSSLSLITNIFFMKKTLNFFTINSFYNGEKMALLVTKNSKLFSYVLQKNLKFYKKFSFLNSDTQLIFCKSGEIISNIELEHGWGRKYVRSAGSRAKLMARTLFNNKMLVKLPSKEIKYFSKHAFCSLGPVGFSEKNDYKKNNVKLKRLRGFRSVVRGIAMNPVDHPHGGKKKSVRFPRSPWGYAAKLK